MKQCFRDVGFEVSWTKDIAEIINNSEYTMCYSFGTKRYYSAKIDNCISVWLALCEDGNDEDVAVTIEYTDGNVYDVLTPEKVHDTANKDFIRLRFEGASYPIDVQLVCQEMAVEFKQDAQYVANIACFALEMQCFDNMLNYMDEFKGLNVKAIANVGHKLSNNPPIVTINGVIKSLKLKTNSYTGIKYYHIDVETLDRSLVVLAEESLVPLNVYEGMIISTTCWCTAAVTRKTGESYNYEFDESTLAEEFIKEISKKIVSLRDLPYEHVCISFSQNTQIDNITFVQTANYGAHYMLEIGKNINGEAFLFRSEETELHTVLKVFYSVCVDKIAPDISKWEDVSHLIEKE